MPAEEEYVEFLEHPVRTVPDPAQGSAAQPPADLRDAGRRGNSQPDVSSEMPSPVTRPRTQPVPDPGPTEEQLQQEEARRRVRENMSDAFSGTENTDQASTAGSDARGDDSGQVGGGWIMPNFAKVPSTVTGSIVLTATIDSNGHVIDVRQTGGTAPAAATPSLVNACMAEVRSKTFTRNDSNAPQRATATITYRFR